MSLFSRGLGELAIFLTFGPLLTLGAYYAISSSTVELFSQGFYNAIYIGIPFGFLTTNILFINQFPDTTSDAKTGKNHLVVTFGKKNSRWGYLIILSAAFLSSYFMLEIFQNNITDFNMIVFLICNLLLYTYGLLAFYNLFKNYNNRNLIFSNLKTIYLQTFLKNKKPHI